MRQSTVLNIAATVGLAIMFAGLWKTFGIWPALAVLGWLVWCTALYCAHVAVAARRA